MLVLEFVIAAVTGVLRSADDAAAILGALDLLDRGYQSGATITVTRRRSSRRRDCDC